MGFEHMLLSTAQSGMDGGTVLLMLMAFLPPIFLALAAISILFVVPKALRKYKHKRMIRSLAIGDTVTTISGLVGTVASQRSQTTATYRQNSL